MKMEILPEPTANKLYSSEIVTHWFTHIVMSALRRSDNENTLSLINLILRSILTDLQDTLKRRWRYLVLIESHIYNRMLIPNYQDIKYQDFHYSDELSNLGRKALYGLKQAPRAWYNELSKFLTSKGFTKGLQIHQLPHGIFINQAKYALKILHKHGMEKGQSIGTPLATKPKLDADLSRNPVDQTDYRSKIRSLKYLTSSIPDIVQAGSSFGLTAFLNADHAGCIDTRKSTSGRIHILDDKLVSWMSKKQDCTTMSSAEAEYMALSAICHSNLMQARTALPYQAHPYSVSLHRGTVKMEILLEPTSNKLLIGSYALSWKPCLGDSLNQPDHKYSIYTKTGNRRLMQPNSSQNQRDLPRDIPLVSVEVLREGHDEEEEEYELYRDVNINQGRGIQTTLEVEDSHVTLTLVNPDGIELIFETTSQMDAQTPTSVAPLPMTVIALTSSTISTITTTIQAPTLPTTSSSTLLQNLPNFSSLFRFDNRLRTLEVKEQVKVQVSKILPRIEQTVNEQLEAEVLTRSSYSSKTSYAVVADLSEMELKKILIKKIEVNKSIQRSDEQRNLYKAFVKVYEFVKIILDTYGEIVMLKRCRDDDADKDEEPSHGPDRGSKRRREGKEPESASAPTETATRSAGRSTQGTKSRQTSASESATAEKPIQTPFEMEEPAHLEFETGQQYPHNLLKPLPLIPNNQGLHIIPFEHFINNDLEYLRGGASSRKYTTSVTKTKAADYGHIKWIEDLVPRTMWIKEPIGYDKHALWGVSHWGRKHQQFYGFAVNQESARDVYSKRRIITVTELKIVEWHNYKHLDWITVRRDDDKLYKFKEGYFKRLHIQDIEDILQLLVQGKLTNLTVKERFAFNVSLRMFTRSIVIQRRVEDLQLGVDSYQKKLNLTKPDTYQSDLKRKEAYIDYSNLRGFIYQNKDKKNRLIRIDELHKFNDGTLTDVRTALDDRLKGIQMQYLPQSIWRKSDKDIAAAMI
uniref:Reverse transcriptase Ty1/copia-type domain-containing protein n=1 Tax=Tanacetum cinerariifolium TaxID=118510 RepID=A0A6L2N3H7_TANCI|nr:hypothetical protein [Tanacetum cinerariifolium]